MQSWLGPGRWFWEEREADGLGRVLEGGIERAWVGRKMEESRIAGFFLARATGYILVVMMEVREPGRGSHAFGLEHLKDAFSLRSARGTLVGHWTHIVR